MWVSWRCMPTLAAQGTVDAAKKGYTCIYARELSFYYLISYYVEYADGL